MLTAVHVPTTVSEALEHLGAGATVLGGGTVLMPEFNTRASPPTEVVSLRRVGLDGIGSEDGQVVVGAATTLATLAADQRVAFLSEAVATIASPPVRTLATVGGNLFAAPPYGDLAVCLLALDAHVDVVGPDGERRAPVAEVVDGGVGSDEFVTAVRFVVPAPQSWRYRKAMRRRHNSASIVTVAAVVDSAADGTVTDARVALGGVGPHPLRTHAVEQALVGGRLDLDHVTTAAAAAVQDADPFDDSYASAWYRTRVLPVHVRRALLGE